MERTELCLIAEKYGTDKVPKYGHVYTPFYYELFKDRRHEIKKVLEIGVANQERMRHIPNYQTGASLRMWRDFFPNARIYGIDIDPNTMFEDERIRTFVQDATDKEGLTKLITQIGSDIDLVIDDGSHHFVDQVGTCQILKPLMKKDVTYIIEDVAYSRRLSEVLGKDYDIDVPYLEGREEKAAQLARERAGPSKNFTKLVIVKSKPTQSEVSHNMKNLMIWISGTGGFHEEASYLVKIQIENALRLGWRPEDVLLVTNFPYEYVGVKATLTKGDHWIGVRPRSINTTAIPALIDEGIIQDGYIYWNHDMDAYQLQTIHPDELELGGYDLGLTDYGWKSRWCMGSFFVKASSKSFIEKVKPIVAKDIEDEDAVGTAMRENPELAKRIKRMNITYNLGQRRVPENVARATKPIKVLHFHPHKRGLMETFKPLMPQGLIDIFAKHGF